MAGNYANLLATIAANVYTNHNNEVSAEKVKAALDGIVSSLTAGGYLWKGIATPTSPGSAQTPDERVFYLATTAGTYTYLGGLVVNAGEAAILYWDTAWHKVNTGIPLVSVSQNTSTGGVDLSVGEDTTVIFPYGEMFADLYGDSMPIIRYDNQTNTYTISFPNYIQIYDNSRKRIRVSYPSSSDVYSIENKERLVLMSDGTLAVKTNSQEAPCFVLLSNNDGVLGGLFAPYFFNERVKEMTANCMWWSSSGDPIITISGENVNVVFPAGKAINVVAKDGTVLLSGISVASGSNSFTVASYNALVWDEENRIFTTKNFGTLGSNNIVFLYNIRGKYFSGLLTPFIDYSTRASLQDMDCYMYWQNEGVPTFGNNSNTTISVKFPNSNFHIYNKNGGMLVQGCASGKNTTFNVATNECLVLDKADNTVKKSGIGTSYPSGCYLLFSNILGMSFTGLMASYYFTQRASKVGLSLYFIGYSNPNFWTHERSVFVTIPSDGFRIYSADGGQVKVVSLQSAQTIEVPVLQKLVLDIADNTMKVVALDVSGNYYDLLTNNNLVVTGLMAGYYMQYTNSIAKLYNTEEEKVILQNINRRNVTSGVPSGLYPLVLLHFSDLHENKVSLDRIMEYHSIYGSQINDILNTGDTMDVYNPEQTDNYVFSTDNDTKYIMTAIGNHDVQDSGGNEIYGGLPVYNKEIKDFVSNWGVVQPQDAGTLGLCYYYKDYANSKIRLIVIDNYAPQAQMAGQLSWFADVMAETLDQNKTCYGYHVVCAAHTPCNMDLIKQSTFCSMDGDGSFGNSMQADFITAVASFIGNGGVFVCWLTGHAHGNYFGLVDEHNEQICISIGAAYFNRNEGSCERVNGTKSQDNFNLVSIDVNTKCIKLHRIGADRDRYLRHVGNMCYNYNTKTLVYND